MRDPSMCTEEGGGELRYGVVIYNYSQEGQHRLRLAIGDVVVILAARDDWFYGYSARNRRQKGIFPGSYIAVRGTLPGQAEIYGTVIHEENPLVAEISSVLREWGTLWKQIYSSHYSAEDNRIFRKVGEMMRDLIDKRRLILSRKLTVDEMRDVKQKVTNLIDIGNTMLGLDLIVRDAEGNILNPSETSAVSLYRQHQLATQRIREKETASHRLSASTNSSFSLFVNVKNFVCRVGEDSDVLMSLYDAKAGVFISENYMMKWGNSGMPKDLDLLHNLRVLYTDLGLKDATREKVFLVCTIIRIGRMDIKDAESKKQTKGIKRPFGIAALDITSIVKGTIDDEEKQHFVPYQMCGEKDSLESVIKKGQIPDVVVAKEVSSSQHKGQGLFVSLKRMDGDFKQALKEHPHLVTNTIVVARKLGFPDVIMPGDVRNDFYVTLVNGEFKRGSKTADKNVEVTMQVCSERSGDPLRDVIFEGAGGGAQTVYKSTVYYHEDRPKWNETIKIAIPLNLFPKAHLKFTFKHRSSVDHKDRTERPFAVSYIRLMKTNGTTLSDTEHELLVYKFDAKRNEKSTMYLDLPSTYRELEKQVPAGMPIKQYQLSSGPLTLNTNDSFRITTLACSTKLTHNVDLMGLLKWRDNSSQLKKHLLTFMSVDGEEVVKFLHDTLDALFNILIQNSESDVYDNLVFDALVFILNLVSDRKYSQFKPVLEVYIKENFSATLAYNKLMVVLKYYIENAHDESRHPSLLKAMRSLEYIFKFIVRSRILFSALNESRGQQQFEISVKQVFLSLNNLMTLSFPEALRIQQSVLKYLPTTISGVISVFDPVQFSLVLIELINSVPESNGKLTRQKMVCINDIIHSALFMRPDCRRYLMPVMLSHVKRLLDGGEERETCIKVISDVMDLLYQPDADTVEDDLTIVCMTILRTTIRTVINLIQSVSLMETERRLRRHRTSTASSKSRQLLEEQAENGQAVLCNAIAVLVSILRQMKPSHYTEYISHFETTSDLLDFLMEVIMVIKDLVRQRVYPQDWNEMIMLQNNVFLTAIRYFANTVRDSFTQNFEHQVWNNYFHCAIAFLTQTHLQLERFSSVKSGKIISKYGDMRREAGFEIRSMWYNLGQYKVQFIPEMVGPILEMTLIPETELRKRTIPIFFDMMQCEFMSQSAPRSKHIKRNFQKFENEMILQLDALVESGHGDSAYKELFYKIIYELCDGHSTMREQGIRFVEMIRELLQHLLEYRSVANDDIRENQMSCLVNLLNFYHKIDRQEMYIRYLHKLADLHLECDNFTEAAHTLLCYVKLLQWSDEALPVMLQSRKYPELETQRELKEKLYYDIIQYLDKGKMWEKGIELCKELAEQYETEIFDYIRLSELLQRQSGMYDSIMKAIRPEPEYFRVCHYGKGFPSFIQNKAFIHRGKEYERLSDFTARVQNHFPNAQLMKTLSPPSEEIKNSNKQYLQINAVTPIMELKHHLQNKKVHGQILKYYKVNEVQNFTYSRQKEGSSNDPANLWLERTTMESSHPFPGILRWYPIIKVNVYEVTPLENAIETLEATNQKIKGLIDAHQLDPTLRVDPLGMVLNGVVDAAVQGGIMNYKRFYQEEFLEDKPQKDHNLVKRLRHVTTMQLLLLQKGLDIHRRHAPESLMPFQAHMEQSFQKMREFVEKEYRIQLTDSDRARLTESFSPSPSPKKRIHTMPPQDLGPGSLVGKSPLRGLLGGGGQRPVTHSPLPRRESPTKVYTRTVSGTSLNTTAGREEEDDDTDSKGSANVTSSVTSSSSLTSRASTTSTATLKAERKSQHTIELDQTLTSARPPRPASRPSSAHFPRSPLSAYTPADSPFSGVVNIDIDGPPEDDQDYDTPPPLPVKKSADRETYIDGLQRASQYNPLNSATAREEPNYAELPSPSEPPPIVPKKTYKESTC